MQPRHCSSCQPVRSFYCLKLARERRSRIRATKSPSQLQGELNLPRRGCRWRGQRSSRRQVCAGRINDFRIHQIRRREVGAIWQVEYLHSELRDKALRDLLDREVLKHRRIEANQSWSIQNVTSGVTPEIETLWIGHARSSRRIRVAVRSPKCHVGRCGNGEALGLDVICDIPRIGKSRAARCSQPIWIVVRVAAG